MALYGLLRTRRGVRCTLFALRVWGVACMGVLFANVAFAEIETATFAAGCFWCIQEPFDNLEGVTGTVVGFSGGSVPNPSYREVVEGDTGHYEVIQVNYDSEVVTYAQLLEVFWRNIDPLDDGGQFCDRGHTYRSAIFAHTRAQRNTAQSSLNALSQSKRFDSPIKTKILNYDAFYPAEQYHQSYYKKNTTRYKTYRYFCGRDRRLQELWGGP